MVTEIEPSVNWLQVAELVTGVVTLFVAACAARVAYRSLSTAKRDARSWATLNACDRYETDQILRPRIEFLKGVCAPAEDIPEEVYREEAALLLWNYFDSVALGTANDLYHADMVYSHLGPIILGWYEDGILTQKHMTETTFRKHYSHTSRLVSLLQEAGVEASNQVLDSAREMSNTPEQSFLPCQG